MRRKRLLAGLGLLTASGLTATLVAASSGSHPVSRPTVATSTTPVVRTTLTNTVSVTATLTYAAAFTVALPAIPSASKSAPAPSTAVFTWLPSAGDIVTPGHVIYKVNDLPVVLLTGGTPAWRTLEPGITDGADILELQAALAALGLEAAPSEPAHWTAATTAAVRELQDSLGLHETGVLPLGDVVFAPYSLRVTTVTATLGAPAQPGPVLTATSTDRTIRASVPVTDGYLIHRDDAVDIVAPDGTHVEGHITSIGKVATAPASSSTSGDSSTPTIAVDVAAHDAGRLGDFDQAPVTVNIVSGTARNVLAVPVTALVPRPAGGYGVWVDEGTTRRLVPVTTGMFSESLVQVSGGGLSEGEHVEVPSS